MRELDYTICSVHSRFALGKTQRTERIFREMDRYFHILGHTTGRLLLKRPGCDIDIHRVIIQAKRNGLLLRNRARTASIYRPTMPGSPPESTTKIAISTDSDGVHEFATSRYGIEQARRAGLERTSILNCSPLDAILGLLKR